MTMDDETFCLQIICLLYGQKLISISLYLHMIYDLIYKFEKKMTSYLELRTKIFFIYSFTIIMIKMSFQSEIIK
jgi:hypothetical protein